MNTFTIGTAVKVKDKPGVVRFVGKTQFASGTWVGVELDQPVGKNDGSINGVRYFTCAKPGNYGLFALPTIVEVQDRKDAPKDSAKATVSKESVVIDRLQSKLQDAIKDIRNYKDQITQLKLRIGQYVDIESSLDQVSVDRDFLQSENMNLHSQLKELQEKYDVLNQELSIVREELELNRELEDEIRLAGSDTDDIKTLGQKNKKLEISLSNLKDISRSRELELTEEIEKLKVSIENGIKPEAYDELLKKLTTAESTIVELKGQLESVTDLALMIDRLTTENELLNLQISLLKAQVDDLVELQELDTNLEAHHAQLEQELRAKINILEANLEQARLKLEESKRKEAKLKENGDGVTDSPLTNRESARNSLALNTNEVKLSLDLAARTRDLVHTRLLYSIAQHQLKMLPSNDQVNTSLPVAALTPIYDYVKGLGSSRHLAAALNLLYQASLYIQKTDPHVVKEILSLVTNLLRCIENHNLDTFSVELVDSCTRVVAKLANNRVFNRICVDYIITECELMETAISAVLTQMSQKQQQEIKDEIQNVRAKAQSTQTLDSRDLLDIIGRYDVELTSMVFEINEYNYKDIDLSPWFNRLRQYNKELDKQFIEENSEQPKEVTQLQVADKDQMIKDLQLTIQLLENNMSNLSASNRQKLMQIQEQLKEVQSKYNDMKNDYDKLKTRNQSLEQEIEELMSSGKYYDVSYLKGRFEDVKGEQAFVNNIKLLEEIQYLRKFVGRSQNNTLDWMRTDHTTYKFRDPYLGVSHTLQKIARSAEILPITRGKWTKRELNPKLVVSTIKYKVSQVNKEMNRLLQGK